MGATFSASAIFRAVDMISAPARRMESALNRFGNQIKEVKRAALGFGAAFAAGALTKVGIEGIVSFDESLASLRAVTGLTGEAFKPFRKEIIAIGDATKKSYPEVAKAMELIGSAQPELLKSAKGMGQVTQASILMSKASGMGLTESAASLTKTMNQFGVGPEMAMKFVDILSTSEQKGTATISNIAAAMENFGPVAKTLGISFDNTNAIIQAFAKGGIMGSDAGTKAAAAMSRMAQSTNSKYNPAIVGATKAIDNLAKAHFTLPQLIKMYGAEGARYIATLINQNDVVQNLSGNLYEQGNAMRQAMEREQAFTNIIQNLRNKFQNIIIKINEGTGALGLFGRLIKFVTNHLGFLIGSLTVIIGLYSAYRIIVWAVRAAEIAKNIVLGLSVALQYKNIMALHSSVIALNAYKVAMAIAKGATFLFSAALWACPITWIVAGILALVVGIILLIKHWDKVKKKIDEWSNSAFFQIAKVMFPILKIIELIAFMQDRWAGIKKAFQDGGFLNGIMAIGKALISFILKPFEVILKFIGKLTGAKWATNWANSIESTRSQLDKDLVNQGEKEKPVNKDASVLTQKQITESRQTQNVQIDINDATGRASLGGQIVPIPVRINNTKGGFGGS